MSESSQRDRPATASMAIPQPPERALAENFRLIGLSPQPFEHLFELSEQDLANLGALRVVADASPGYPCRVSLVDAAVGDDLLLLPYCHQPAPSPYRASGPIYVRRGAAQADMLPGEVPDCVTRRLMSVRAYDDSHMLIDATVCEGPATAGILRSLFQSPTVTDIHLHNAKQGCFSCAAVRVAADLAQG
jgi:hypothetical protein